MAKVKIIHNDKEDPPADYVVYGCYGCGHTHSVPAKRWNFNGDVDKPTLTPSVRHYSPARPAEDGCDAIPEKTHCHYFIREGRIEYCSDCPHKFAGQTLDLPDVEEDIVELRRPRAVRRRRMKKRKGRAVAVVLGVVLCAAGLFFMAAGAIDSSGSSGPLWLGIVLGAVCWAASVAVFGSAEIED